MTCELCALNSDIAFPARSLAKQVIDNVLCVSGRDAAAGEEGKQAVCRVAVTGDVVDKNRLVGYAEEVLLGLDDKHGIDGAQVFFGVGKRGVGGGDQLILHRETGAVGADEQRIALPRALGDVGAPFGPLLRVPRRCTLPLGRAGVGKALSAEPICGGALHIGARIGGIRRCGG